MKKKKENEFPTFQINTINSNLLNKWKNYLIHQKNLLIKEPLKNLKKKI